MRALYLDAREPVDVALDGPALRVRAAARAPCRYPLRQLSRVLVSGRVQWQTQALLECMRHGIPVTFLDDDGQLVGLCLGARADGLSLHDRLAEFANRPDWREHYAIWFKAAERRAILGALRRLAIHLDDLRPAAARSAVAARLAEVAAGRSIFRVCGYLEASAFGIAARTLKDSGVPPGLLVDEAQSHHLARDLGRLLVWDTRVAACQLLQCSAGIPNRAELAAALEACEPRLWKLCHDHLALFESRLAALNFGD